MPVRMTREGRAETREAKRTEQTNQESKSGKAAGFSSTSQKGNIVHGKLKSQKELKKITGSEDYKKSDYEGKTKMLNVATANKGMSVKQKKLAAKAPPPNKLDEKDFAVLRAEKAKGRGMGLQDEKVKPGKVMKANLGILAMKKAKDKGAKGAEFLSPIAMAKRMFNKKSGGVIKAKRGVFSSGKISDMSFDEKMKRVESGQINKKTGKFTSMNAMRDAKGFQKGESAAEFNKRRMKLAGAKKALSATRIGKIVLPIAAAGVAAQQYLKSKMKKKDEPKKKMGGGIMQKPMGYKHGTKPGAGPLAGLGRPAPRSQQQKKKKEADVVLMMPVKEGPANRHTTIKKFSLNRKMGGGMMQKPMGYNTGGYKSKEDRKKAEKNIKEARSKEGLRSFLSDGPKINQPMRKERYMEGRKARHSAFKKKLGRTAAGIASSLNPVTSAARLIGKVMGKESKKRDFQKGDYGDISVKKMGGGMMQKPMGYSKGVSVKARGCKLGRTRPTKIT